MWLRGYRKNVADLAAETEVKLQFSLSSTVGLFEDSIVAGWPFNDRNSPNVDDREKDSLNEGVGKISRSALKC
jgi:hypothetical protein